MFCLDYVLIDFISRLGLKFTTRIWKVVEKKTKQPNYKPKKSPA